MYASKGCASNLTLLVSGRGLHERELLVRLTTYSIFVRSENEAVIEGKSVQ